jgi:hypothetical protein
LVSEEKVVRSFSTKEKSRRNRNFVTVVDSVVKDWVVQAAIPGIHCNPALAVSHLTAIATHLLLDITCKYVTAIETNFTVTAIGNDCN